jgi:hypothetical protein
LINGAAWDIGENLSPSFFSVTDREGSRELLEKLF